MFEYWACFGLACIDDEFLDKLKKAWDKEITDTVADVVKKYGFRFSQFELAELEYILANRRGDVVASMQAINQAMCAPPPRPCPCRSASSAELYDRYKTGHHGMRDKDRHPNR
jgi:hypothetical protein